jgi:hypothetical protein
MTPAQALQILAQVANMVKVTISEARQIEAALEVFNNLINKKDEE